MWMRIDRLRPPTPRLNRGESSPRNNSGRRERSRFPRGHIFHRGETRRVQDECGCGSEGIGCCVELPKGYRWRVSRAQLCLLPRIEDRELTERNCNRYSATYTELSTIRAATQGTTLKLILETSQLSREQIIASCILAGFAGFDFVKTSTGFNGAGASEANVRVMRACCEKLHAEGVGQGLMKVKASGGVRTLQDAKVMLGAGAERLGTSGGVTIAREGKGEVKSVGGRDSAAY